MTLFSRSRAKRADTAEDRDQHRQHIPLIFDVIGDALFYIGVEPHGVFRFLSVNKPFLNTTGLSEAQVVGKTIDEVIPPPSLKTVRANYLQAIATGETVEWEESSVYSGEERIGHVAVSPVFDPDGTCTHLVGSVHDITDSVRRREELQEADLHLREILVGTVRALSISVDLSDRLMAGHQNRVAELGRAIAEELGYPIERVEGIYFGGLLHDIGRSGIPGEILNRSGKLTEVEFAMVKQHPRAGYDTVESIEFPWPVGEMILHHHERLDGSGYPDGLRDGDISEEAMIIGVSDVVEAMCSHRPYRPALGIEAALEEITSHRGTLYQASIVDACVRLFTEKDFSLINPDDAEFRPIMGKY